MSSVLKAIPLSMPMGRNLQKTELILQAHLDVLDFKCSADARLSNRIANLGLYFNRGVWGQGKEL